MGKSCLRPFICFGTRPEAIKLAPVIHECIKHEQISPVVCSTGQHKEMLDQASDYFELAIDFKLNVMKHNQTLASLTTTLLDGLNEKIIQTQPDCIIAQGDTTTVLAAAMTAFYNRLPFCHVEAGLRTYNLQSPWPEEFNRRVAGLCTSLHFAPTTRAASALSHEGISRENIFVTGNTVIDALKWARKKELAHSAVWTKKYEFLVDSTVVLITGHRRENFGDGFQSIFKAIKKLADAFPKFKFVFPVHLNPNVQKPVADVLGQLNNVHLIPPTPYPEFIWLMDRSYLIITDSGGVQEEGPSFHVPIIVTRDTTERPEAVEAGAVVLVGTDEEKLFEVAQKLLTNKEYYLSHTVDENPYGDGTASSQIIQILLDRFLPPT